MACTDDCHGEIPQERPSLWKNPAVRVSGLSWIAIILAFAAAPLGATVQTALFGAAVVSGAFYFAREAWEELWQERRIGIELLMTAAIAGAAALGQWREAALVAGLYSISEALEGFTIQRTRFAIRGLMDLVPERARVIRQDVEVEVAIGEVVVGDRIRIRPGESIPIDGVIREGVSAINESAVTGESLPVEREVGQPVFAGTLNGNGSLLVEATKTFADNTVSRIIELVERAQAQKGRSQLFVERFGRIYSPVVLGTSLLVALVPLVVGAEPVASIQRAIALLVAASPCALAVATPVTLVAAIGAAARRGILIKGGGVLEALGAVRAVALDKTGTLTVGRPSVTEVKPLSLEWMELLRLTAAVEELSEHPLAQAIVRHARESKLEWPQAKEFTALTGAGASGTVMEKLVAVLKPDAARKLGVKLDAVTERWQHQAEERGHSVVIVTVDKAPAGLIALADTVRPEAKALVAALQRNGVKHIVLLTGDNAGTARAIATEVGIENYHGGLLPEDKVERVQRLHEEYGGVAMVGDGINDAPALAAASVGIAMGAAGSDAAIAAADVALMADDLSKLSDAIALGRRSRRILAQNIAASLLIVGALVAGVFAADLSMFCAVVAHEGTEVLIILNALRALL